MKFFCYITLIILANAWEVCAQTNATINANTTTNANTNAVSQILALVTTNAPAAKPKASETVIEADGPAEFDRSGHSVRVVYRDHVRVDAPDLKLRCEWLAADIPENSGQPTNIVAETNVVFDATVEQGKKMHGTGDKAVYVFGIQDGVTNKTVTLWGQPAKVESAEVTQTGDMMILDLTRNILKVPVNPKTVYREILKGAAAPGNAPVMVTNSPPTTTNQTTVSK